MRKIGTKEKEIAMLKGVKMEQHRIHDNCCIKETIPGTWLVYDHDREPVSGTAVYQYPNGIIKCEADGIGMNPENPIKKDCIHIHRVRVWLGEQVLDLFVNRN